LKDNTRITPLKLFDIFTGQSTSGFSSDVSVGYDTFVVKDLCRSARRVTSCCFCVHMQERSPASFETATRGWQPRQQRYKGAEFYRKHRRRFQGWCKLSTVHSY